MIQLWRDAATAINRDFASWAREVLTNAAKSALSSAAREKQ